MEYTYSFRIYPNEEQIILISKTFGCCRFIYNYFLDYSNSNGYSSKYTNNNTCNKELKVLYPWLREVDKFAITNAIYNLDNAYKRYMNKLGGMPKFKKKNKGESYQTNYTNNNIEVLDNYIKLPKLGKVLAKVYRKVEGTIINATIKKYSNNKYKVMLLVRKEIKKLETNSYIVGIDMGVSNFVHDSSNNIYNAPKELMNTYGKIGKLQKSLSLKMKGSNNYKKIENKINKLYDKCNNVRNDFLHKLSTSIINENQVIVVEDLNVKKMFQNKNIVKVLGDISISKFINMLEYKARWYGRKLIKVGRYYPSSQLCNNCGYQNKKIKDYSIRSWQCPKCDSIHDRDYNAANNILDKGIELLLI